MKTRVNLLAAALLASSALVAGSTGAMAEGKSIATVVKIAGIQWFNRMEEGVKKYAADTSNKAFPCSSHCPPHQTSSCNAATYTNS